MTLAWAVITVAVLFFLHEYKLLGKSLRITGIVTATLIVCVLGWLVWNHFEVSLDQHQANVQFALKNECLDPSTGKVHPVRPSGEPWCQPNESIHQRGASIDQWAINTELPTVPAGEYIVREGEAGREIGGEGTPAQLCVDSAGIRHCFLFFDGNEAYDSNAEAHEVKLSSGGKLILLTAEHDISADSTVRSIALLANRGGELKNILSLKHSIEDYAIWNLPDISRMPILLTAYSIWDMDTECHACAHRYTIASYVYNTLEAQYVQFDQLSTSAKYESNAKIFDLEKEKIVAGLKRAFDAEAKRHLILAP